MKASVLRGFKKKFPWEASEWFVLFFVLAYIRVRDEERSSLSVDCTVADILVPI